MIKFELFSKLYREVPESTSQELYIAERGWQDWMDDLPEDDVANILIQIFDLYHADIKGMRSMTGMSRPAFADRYGIPVRTIENWEATGASSRNCPDYLKMLIAYTLV